MLCLSRWRINRNFASLRSSLRLAWTAERSPFVRALSTRDTRKTQLSDPDVEASFLRRFQEVQKRPDATEVAHLIWFLASESEDLDADPILVELCDFAATRASSFTPGEIDLIFNVCLKRMASPHQALLQNVAESLLESGDLSSFPSATIAQILSYISRRTAFPATEMAQELFPGQKAFVELLLGEATGKERLERLSVGNLKDIFCSAAVSGHRDVPRMERLKARLLKRDVLLSLTAKEVAHIAYAAANLHSTDPMLVSTMAQIFPQRAKKPEDVQYLGVILLSLVRQGSGIGVPSSLVEFFDRATADQIQALRNEDLACWMYSIGKLSLPHPELLKRLSNEIQKPERLQNMMGQQILSIMQAVHDLRWSRGRSLIEALSHEVLVGTVRGTGKTKISQFNALQLCGILHVWSRMGLHKNWGLQVLLHELIRDCRRHELTDISVGLMMHSMGLIALYDAPTMDFLKQEWLHKDKLKGFGDQALTMVIYGLSRLPRNLCLSLMEAVMTEMAQEERLRRSDSVRLISLLHSMATARLHLPFAAEALLQEAVQTERLKSMSERCLAHIVHSVGKLRYLKFQRREICERVILEALQPQRMKKMDNQALSNLLMGLGQAQYHDHSHVKQFAWELLKPHRSQDLSQKDCIQLVHLVQVLARLGVPDCDAILDAVSEAILEKGVRSFASVGIVVLVTRLEQLNYRNVQIYRALINEAIRRDQMGQLNTEDMPMMMQSIARLGYTPIFTDLMRLGLKDFSDLQRYTVADLKRLMQALLSMKQSEGLVKRLEKRILELTVKAPFIGVT